MNESLDYWKFLAGLGLFLYGMKQLESSLKELASKRFKLFLKKYTTNRFLAILNGAVASALLQSSSIVLLMVIAFAGAGIITLSNSLGIILGANLGTTLTGWLVSTFGFNVSIEAFILPLIGIGSLGLIFVSKRFLFYHVFGFIIAIGLVFMGLNFMKIAMGQLATGIDLSELENLGIGFYFLFGLLITAIIQSSSAMMSITLSALYANIITLEPAALIIVGADLGTTMTALIASYRGTPVKKRVGLAHFFFNLTTAILAVFYAKPLLYFINENLNITDPLFALVTFHSSFNLLGIILFVPFLGSFEKFLNRFFINNQNKSCLFIHKVSAEIPEAALEAVRLELNHFLQRVFAFNSHIVGLPHSASHNHQEFRLLKIFLADEDILKEYEWIKIVESELLEYFVAIQKENLEESESKKLNQYVLALRNGVQSAKSSKDIKHNLDEFRQSVTPIVESFLSEIYKEYSLIHLGIQTNDLAYQHINTWVYAAMPSIQSSEIQIATFLNVNREIYSSGRLLIDALKDISEASELLTLKR